MTPLTTYATDAAAVVLLARTCRLCGDLRASVERTLLTRAGRMLDAPCCRGCRMDAVREGWTVALRVGRDA